MRAARRISPRCPRNRSSGAGVPRNPHRRRPMAFEQGGALVNPGAKITSATITTPTIGVGWCGFPKLAKLALSQLHTAPLAWQLPENAVISVAKLYVSTIATAAATLNIGYTATSAVTSADNLIDGVDVHTATGLFDNITDHG